MLVGAVEGWTLITKPWVMVPFQIERRVTEKCKHSFNMKSGGSAVDLQAGVPGGPSVDIWGNPETQVS